MTLSVLTMKIAVTAEEAQREVDPHFARALTSSSQSRQARFVILQRIRCPPDSAHLAGTQAAGTLIGLGVQAMIVGQIGPKAFATFQAAGVRVFQAKEKTVAEAVHQCKQNSPELTGATPEHFGLDMKAFLDCIPCVVRQSLEAACAGDGR